MHLVHELSDPPISLPINVSKLNLIAMLLKTNVRILEEKLLDQIQEQLPPHDLVTVHVSNVFEVWFQLVHDVGLERKIRMPRRKEDKE